MKSFIIQKISANDLYELQKISKQTFYETFSQKNSEDNMQKYLDKNFSISKLSDEILGNSEFYFAIINGTIAGYLKINFENYQTELKYKNSVEIERIYVLKKFQKNKIGQSLIDLAIKLGKRENAEFLWLGVWEDNLNTINFYKKNGFAEFDKHIFLLGEEKQTDIMMKLNLKSL